LLVRLPPRMLVKMEVHLDSKTKEQADGEQVSVGGCLIPVRWMQLGRLRCGLPRLLCPLSLSLLAYYLTRILSTSLPVLCSGRPALLLPPNLNLSAPAPSSRLQVQALSSRRLSSTGPRHPPSNSSSVSRARPHSNTSLRLVLQVQIQLGFDCIPR